ncbi:MAG: serine hydrolase [Parvibaculaceae bacterium]|nr:serine hydrolase [Parvibaculaceae bacterium]
MTNALPPLPAQPATIPWPTGEWPEGPAPEGTDTHRLKTLLDEAFAAKETELYGETHATLIVQGGRIVAERYGEGFDAATTCPSWSKGKSITQALAGILVGDGKLDIHAPADVPEWQSANDPRRPVTLDLLLRMSSGLAFREDYVDGEQSDVIEMLWGKGKDDVAHFAASLPLEHAPGSFWSYASGTTNIVARALARAIDAYGPDFERFMNERLFGPIGIKSAKPKFDKAGTFIGSSFCYMTPRDFARFGLLYLRNGVWDGTRILPEGWVDYARTATFQQPGSEDSYGAHWWLGIAGKGSFSANGFEGQYTALVPDKDLVIVRHGKTPLHLKDNTKNYVGELAACFPAIQ